MSRIKIELKTASVEQVAAQLLTIIRENNPRNPPENHYAYTLLESLELS